MILFVLDDVGSVMCIAVENNSVATQVGVLNIFHGAKFPLADLVHVVPVVE